MAKTAMTADAALLLGLETAISEDSTGAGGFSRHTWLLKVLVEQLMDALPSDSETSRAVQRLCDEQRGVTNRAVTRATEHLLADDFLEPWGVGEAAVWRLTERRSADLLLLKRTLSRQERAALKLAAQRTLARAVAWSKAPQA